MMGPRDSRNVQVHDETPMLMERSSIQIAAALRLAQCHALCHGSCTSVARYLKQRKVWGTCDVPNDACCTLDADLQKRG